MNMRYFLVPVMVRVEDHGEANMDEVINELSAAISSDWDDYDTEKLKIQSLDTNWDNVKEITEKEWHEGI